MFTGINKKEIVRQLTHLTAGIIGIININFNFLPFFLVIPIFIISIIVFILLNIREVPQNFQRVIYVFERENGLIAQGMIALFASYIILHSLSLILIDLKSISLASMAIVAYGDSASTIFGIQFKGFPLPYNKKKNLIGLLTGITFASLAAFIFLKSPFALIAATAAMLVESFDIKIYGFKIDDNLLIPFVAFIVLLASTIV